MSNDTIAPKTDVLSGLHISINEQLEVYEDTQFRRFKICRDMFDAHSNHISHITHPILCDSAEDQLIVHAEHKQGVL